MTEESESGEILLSPENSLEALKQQNLALVEALKTLPIATVSDLISKMPDIEISDEL